jgi:hypothetical protein
MAGPSNEVTVINGEKYSAVPGKLKEIAGKR